LAASETAKRPTPPDPPAGHHAGGAQRPQRGDPGDRQRGRERQVDRPRHLGERAEVHRGELREGAGRQPHHAGALGRAAAADGGKLDHAGDV
jgi:hypothetical protein